MEIIFTRPVYLFLLFVIPSLVAFHFFTLRSRKVRALQFANFEAIARVKGIELYSKNILSILGFLLVFIFLIFSLAGISIIREAKVSSFSFVIALDVSRSMEATDLAPTRFDVARNTAIDFVRSLPYGTRVGVISFSGNAFIHQSLTDDSESVVHALKKITLGALGGTDLAEAIVTSANLLENEPAKAVVLLSDGQTNVGTLDDAIAYAVRRNVVVYTMGIGTTEGGSTTYGLSKLDEESLQALSYETNGQFFLVNTTQKLTEAFGTIASLKVAAVTNDISRETLFLAFLILLILYAIRSAQSASFP